MTAEIFLTSLRKLASAGFERLATPPEPANETKAAARTQSVTPLSSADGDADTYAYAPPTADVSPGAALYQGLPPPPTSGIAPETLVLLTNSIVGRIDKPVTFDLRHDPSMAEAARSRTTSTDVEFRPNVGVVETVYVDGVPTASAVIATDDRARLVPDDLSAMSGRPPAAADPVNAPQSAVSVEQQLASHVDRPDDDLTPLLRDLAAALSSMPIALHDTSAISSFVFNAAMIPGWPPPSPVQAGPVAETQDSLSAEKRAELIAKLMAEMGIEPLTEAELREMRRKPSARLLRRIALVLSAILVSLSAIAEDLVDLNASDSVLETGRYQRPGTTQMRKRLYIE